MKKDEIEELREYRRLKASGRMIILPEWAKDGDTVWYIEPTGRISSHLIVEWVIITGRLFGKFVIARNEDDYWYEFFSPEEDFGVRVFLTKEEAEAAALAHGKLLEADFTVDPAEEVFGGEENVDVSDNR